MDEELREYAYDHHLSIRGYEMDVAAKSFWGFGRESSTIGMVCLFSGRFDRPHLGHIIQAMRLGQRFQEVIIPVLDYPQQKYPIHYRLQVMEEALSMARGKYTIFSNKKHFGKITKEEILDYEFDVYCSGNVECLRNMESLGFKTMFLERAYDYAASQDFLLEEIRKLLT